MKGNFKFLIKYIKREKNLIISSILLTILLTGIQLIIPYISESILNKGVVNGSKRVILILGGVLIATYIIKSIINASINVFTSKISIKIISKIKEDLYSHMLNLPLSFFDSNKIGYLMSRISEVDSLASIFSTTVFNFIISIFTGIGSLIIILKTSPKLLLLIIVFMFPIYLLTRKSMNGIHNASLDLMEVSANTDSKVQESFQGIMELKQTNSEEKGAKEMSNEIEILKKKSIFQNKILAFSTEGITILVSLYTVVLNSFIGISIVNGELNLGQYVSLAQYALLVYSPIQQLSIIGITVQSGIVALKRVIQIFDNDIEDKGKGKESFKVNINSIELKNVSFKYKENKDILKDLSFKINENKSVALTGKNGSGKTTVVKLIMGFYSNYEGDILINNISLKRLNIEELRNRIGIVSQRIFLFSGSIEDNLKLGNDNVDDEKLDYISELLQDNIFNSENRKNIFVLEGGKNLSGGQIQKIAIARSILRNADIFIFDEATANIDIESKNVITNIIKNNLKDKIRIIISHDSEVVTYTDEIIYIDNNSI